MKICCRLWKIKCRYHKLGYFDIDWPPYWFYQSFVSNCEISLAKILLIQFSVYLIVSLHCNKHTLKMMKYNISIFCHLFSILLNSSANQILINCVYHCCLKSLIPITITGYFLMLSQLVCSFQKCFLFYLPTSIQQINILCFCFQHMLIIMIW